MKEGRSRILHLIHTGGPGGAEAIFRSVVTGLPQDRWESVPAVPPGDWLHQALIRDGVEPLPIAIPAPSTIASIERLRGILRVHSVDLVHAHMFGAAVHGTLATACSGIPVVSTFHGAPDFSGASLMTRAKLAMLTGRGNRVVFVSASLRDSILARFDLPVDRVHVVHNGVSGLSDSATSPDPAPRRARGGEMVIGAIGNLRPAKDYPTLLRAVRLARDRGIPTRLLIAGEGRGALYDDILGLRTELGLEEHVKLMGFVSDVGDFLSTVDVFVSSSTTEGFSLATVEALLLERPVIATRSGGPEEILDHGRTGWLVPIRDPEAMAGALQELWADPAGGATLARAGRLDVQERFSRARMISGYEQVYTLALDATSRSHDGKGPPR